MRIVINALSARTGGGLTYLNNLLLHLVRIDKQNDYTVLVTPENRSNVLGEGRSRIAVEEVGVGSVWRRLLYEQVGLPRLLDRLRADLVFAPAEIAPLRADCPVVLGIQNPHPYYDEGVRWPLSQRIRHLVLRTVARPSARKARRVIFVSETSRRHISRVLGIEIEKTRAIHHGVDVSHFGEVPPGEAKAARDLFCGGDDFILSVSDLMPHKNYPMLMDAYSLLSDELRHRYRLLIVGGGTRDQTQTLKEHSEGLGMQERIVFSGSVPHQELAAIYSGATLFVMPSRLETFGIPLIEAMASGLPVMAARASAIPEVLGNAGLLFDPNDVEGLSDGMASALTDEKLRLELIDKGRARAADFSLEATARQTLEVFEEAYKSAQVARAVIYGGKL